MRRILNTLREVEWLAVSAIALAAIAVALVIVVVLFLPIIWAVVPVVLIGASISLAIVALKA